MAKLVVVCPKLKIVQPIFIANGTCDYDKGEVFLLHSDTRGSLSLSLTHLNAIYHKYGSIAKRTMANMIKGVLKSKTLT